MELTGKIWRGFYADSIALMQVAEAVRCVPGVASVALLMATPANRAALEAAGMWPDGMDDAGVTDLVLAVCSEGTGSAHAALERAEDLLTRPRPRGDTLADRNDEARSRSATAAPGPIRALGGVEGHLGAPHVMERPRSITTATRAWPEANLAVISVPGSHALNEAHQALSRGLHVFLFSDGVPLAGEIALKHRARALGLLVMGPECGTSILGGVGVGFANAVRRGSIGLVGASGTGLQEAAVLIDRLGGGVSHAIGTGGRDLHEAVDGITTRQALRCLADDEATSVIVLVSKPPSAGVAGAVLTAAATSGKPVVACLLGWNGTIPQGVRAVDTLQEAAEAAVSAAGGSPPRLEVPAVTRRAHRAGGRVRGFYTGGTLCEEARRLVGDGGHHFIDFGTAEYTSGRPHPMIDPGRRNEAVAAAGDDRDASVLLVDVVLGYGAHPDPAQPLAQAILEARARAERRGRVLDVVARVVGTEADPQGLSGQEAKLRSAGAIPCPSNRLAAEVARDLVTRQRVDLER